MLHAVITLLSTSKSKVESEAVGHAQAVTETASDSHNHWTSRRGERRADPAFIAALERAGVSKLDDVGRR